MSSLFRQESLQARNSQWLGRPIILPSTSLRLFSWFCVVVVAAVALFAIFGTYTRRVQVSGFVVPVEGVARILSPQVGWISDLRVREGDEVTRGDVLYTLSLDVTTEFGDTQHAVLDNLSRQREEIIAAIDRQITIDATEKDRLADEVVLLEAELPPIIAQIAMVEEFIEQLRGFLDRQQALLERGMSVSAEYETRLPAYHSQRMQLPGLQREKVQIERNISELHNRLAGFDLQAEARLGQLRQEVLGIERQISVAEAQRELTITAPRDGIVTGIVTLAGQTVAMGTPLLSIVPNDQPLVVQLLAPSNTIGFVREGTEVLLRYQAFPYQKFGQYPAVVTVISRANLLPEEVVRMRGGSDPAMGDVTLYRITVEPQFDYVNAYGQQEPLQAGMQVDAHLLVDNRPLYQWILEPIYGLRRSM